MDIFKIQNDGQGGLDFEPDTTQKMKEKLKKKIQLQLKDIYSDGQLLLASWEGNNAVIYEDWRQYVEPVDVNLVHYDPTRNDSPEKTAPKKLRYKLTNGDKILEMKLIQEGQHEGEYKGKVFLLNILGLQNPMG